VLNKTKNLSLESERSHAAIARSRATSVRSVRSAGIGTLRVFSVSQFAGRSWGQNPRALLMLHGNISRNCREKPDTVLLRPSADSKHPDSVSLSGLDGWTMWTTNSTLFYFLQIFRKGARRPSRSSNRPILHRLKARSIVNWLK
jgi:hypothetical protein